MDEYFHSKFLDFAKVHKFCPVIRDDKSLVLINPTEPEFFSNVLGFVGRNAQYDAFESKIQQVKNEVVAGSVGPFYRPICDPSLKGDKVVYKKGRKPAVGNSFAFWEQKAEEMRSIIDGYIWKVGNECQYYCFLVWLINHLVDEGWKIDEAMTAVVLDSKELGHYWNSDNAKGMFERTGSREICGMYDVGNTSKILSCTIDEVGGYWQAGGFYDSCSDSHPLADLSCYHDKDSFCFFAVGWLVLTKRPE